MLCFQDCVDMCDLSPDDERVIRDSLTLAEIGEALASCAKREKPDAEDCSMLHPVRIATKPLPMPYPPFCYRSPSGALPNRLV